MDWFRLAFRDLFDMFFDPLSLYERGQKEEQEERESKQG